MASKKGRSVLGPRGRRRLGRDENCRDQGVSKMGQKGGLAKIQSEVRSDGHGVFPKDWLDNCKVPPKDRKQARFVLEKEGNQRDVFEWDTAKLATHQKSISTHPVACLNPFTDIMPFGNGRPLPRFVL